LVLSIVYFLFWGDEFFTQYGLAGARISKVFLEINILLYRT